MRAVKRLLYYFTAIILFWSCDEDQSPRMVPVELQMGAHNSDNEFYAKVPVQFGIIEKGIAHWKSVELFVNGEKIEGEFQQFMRHSFSEPGTYEIRAEVKMSNNIQYQLDTLINIATAPPVFGQASRGEEVMFGWEAGSDYMILMSTYHGSTARDYEILTINEAVEQQGSFQTIDLGAYPDVVAHGSTASGKLALIYDYILEIFNESMQVERQLYFVDGGVPRDIFINGNEGILLFDSLSHIILKKVDLTTGKLIRWSSRNVGVEGMTLFNHFFLSESKVATYHVEPGNAKTLLMGVDVAGNVEFSQYFLPPVFITDVTPLSDGGCIISSVVSEENKFTVLKANSTGAVQWRRTFIKNSPNSAVKQVGQFLYVFFDNMRCVKLSLTGEVMWDKYFYPATAYFEDALITLNGDLIMVGTNQPFSDTFDQLLQIDIVCIKINADGLRID
jgi:hypothetical protein